MHMCQDGPGDQLVTGFGVSLLVCKHIKACEVESIVPFMGCTHCSWTPAAPSLPESDGDLVLLVSD